MPERSIEIAFRRAIAGDPFSRVDLELQAKTFFSLADSTSNSERWGAWWHEIAESGGVDSWLYRSLDRDAKTTLGGLKGQGYRLIAASNSDGTLRQELASFGLLDYFDVTIDSAEIGCEKPTARFYHHVLGALDHSPTLHVGDDLVKDFIGPIAAGFQRALLYDPVGIYAGLPPAVRLETLGKLGNAIGEGL